MTLFELNLPKQFEEEYIDKLRPGLINRIINGVGEKNKVKLSKSVIDILIPGHSSPKPDYSVLDKLLIGTPEILIEEHSRITDEISKLKRCKQPKLKDIERVFNYDGQLSQSKSKGYWLSKLIQSPTCCYCNRQYAFTIERNGGTNDDNRIARPAFDHWFPKEKYPLLSLSLYNLIPCCTVCNSSTKGITNMNLQDYIHPYVHRSPKPKIKFVVETSTEPDERWTIKINRKKNSPEDNTIKLFSLDEIYRMHNKLELKDIMDFRDNYPDDYIKDLMNLLKNAQINTPTLTRKDIYRMLFGVEYDDDKHLDRPFGKMKNDILKEILE